MNRGAIQAGATMDTMYAASRRFLLAEDGPAAVEYAVMAALIVVVCVTAIKSIGSGTIGSFGAFGAAMSATAGSGS
jgi:pilus assembly protein Flp/PilA